jgi:alkylation response protein AidB-like acyl-CoA dehydrogenase
VDFTLSEEQRMLQASARELLEDRYPPERLTAVADGDGYPREEWKELAGLGWTSIAVPEDEGGAGLGFVEEALLAEELGRAVFPGPLLSSIVLALPVLRLGGAADLAATVASGERLATVAWPAVAGLGGSSLFAAGEGGRLGGHSTFVPDLALADLVVVLDSGSGWVLERDGPGVTWHELPTIDGTRRLGEIALQGAPADRLELPDGFEADLLARAWVAMAAEAVGVASRALDLALAHAKAREQFGRPIGSFQAVSHPLADTLSDLETTRSLVYWAAWAVDAGAPEADAAAAAAKARAGDVSTTACERSIQVHGGIGFTWEHVLHRLYRRALGISQLFGSATELRGRVAEHLLDGPYNP